VVLDEADHRNLHMTKKALLCILEANLWFMESVFIFVIANAYFECSSSNVEFIIDISWPIVNLHLLGDALQHR